jgi:signal transduction histidine kinase
VLKDFPVTLVALVHGGEILQVASNLVENAVDALPNDGILRLRLRSRGHGIPSAQLSDIFTPYFTTKKERGTGLGLSVSKAIVERHGGTIRVRSNNLTTTGLAVASTAARPLALQASIW